MIIIYNLESGLSIWEKNFDVTMSEESQLFASFFSAIQNMVMEIVKSNSEEKSLRELNLADKFVQITPLAKLRLEIITIADQKDRNHIAVIHQKIKQILESHPELFIWDKWNGDVSRFSILDYEILGFVHTLFDKMSLTDAQKQYLSEIWRDSPKFEQKMINAYREEEKNLRIQLKMANSLHEKRLILEALEKCIRVLKDIQAYEIVEKDLKRLRNEIEDTKKRAIYFLKTAKDLLNKLIGKMDLDLKEVYLYLYSFATKLRTLGVKNAEQYKTWALQLLDNNQTNRAEIIKKILHLPEEIEAYISA